VNSSLALRLDEEGRSRVLDHCITRVSRLQEERERSDYYQKRLRFERLAADDYSHRSPEATFKDSNFNLPVTRGIVRYLRGRMRKDIFGSEPYFMARPRGGRNDGALADKVQKHFGFKLGEANYTAEKRKELRAILELGDVPTKTTYVKRKDYSERLALLLVDPDTGDMIIDPATEEPIEFGVSEIPPDFDISGLEWRELPVENEETLYSGLEVRGLNFRDVLIPMNVAEVEDADFVAHRYAESLLDLKARFGEDNEEWGDIERLLKAESTLSKDHDEAREDLDREDRVTDVVDDENPPIRVTECYFEMDVASVGKKSRVYAVLLEDHGILLDLRYLAEISPRSKYPIQVLAINKKRDQWWGEGIYEIYENLQDEIDRLANGIRLRNDYNADPAKIFNPELLATKGTNRTFDLTRGTVHEVSQRGVRPEEIFSAIQLPDLDSRTWQLMELYQQFTQVESGVTNANQGDLSGLPSNTTATGINSMLESSSVLHLDLLDELRDQLSQNLTYCAEVLYFWQDADETFDFLEGDADAVMMLRDAKAVARMHLDVDLVMTRGRKQEMRESAMAAIPMQERFFQLPPGLQTYALPLYLAAFKGMDIDHADDMFPSMEDIEQQMQAEAQAQQAQAMAEQQMARAQAGGGMVDDGGGVGQIDPAGEAFAPAGDSGMIEAEPLEASMEEEPLAL
jgi:hypothetical protein